MEKITEIISNDKIAMYDLVHRYFGDKKVCMFDIETTGLSPLKSFTYIIGINIFEEGSWKIIQLFNDDGRSEPEMIRNLHRILEEMDILIEFNGDTFDIPYIEKRMDTIERKYHISMVNNFSKVESFDLLKNIRPYKNSLGLPNLKQKTIERYIGLNRVDMYNGGQLIDVYLGYLASGDKKSRELVLRHNRDDMEGMIYLSSTLGYNLMCSGDLEITGMNTRVRPNSSVLRFEVDFKLGFELVRPVAAMMDQTDLDIDGKNGKISIPVSEGALRYYYGSSEKDGYEEAAGYFVPGPLKVPDKITVYKEKARDKAVFVMLNDAFLGTKSLMKEYITAYISEIMHYRRSR